MNDKNMTIRNYFIKITDVGNSIFKQFPDFDLDNLLSKYYISLFNLLSNKELYDKYSYLMPNREKYHIYIVEIELVILVVIQDLYISLKEKEKLKEITDEEQSMFEILKKCISENNYETLLNEPKTIRKIVAPLIEMLNASALRKVELMKALEDEDIKLLSSINPFFLEEYDHYNISITEEFLIKHIDIWSKKKDYETAISMITNFLINIFKVNIEDGMKIAYTIINDSEQQTDLLGYLNNGEFDMIAPIVRDMYENNKQNISELK